MDRAVINVSSGVVTCSGSRRPASGSSDAVGVPVLVSAMVGRRRRTTWGVAHQGAHLPGVEDPRPPVEPDPPPREGPPEVAGERGDDAVALAEEQQREGVEQVERRGLAEEVHREGRVAAGPQDRYEPPQQQVAQRQGDGDPPRDDVAHVEAEDHGQDVEPVGHRVEDLPQPGVLVEPAREPSVEEVGEPGDHQHHERDRVGLRPEHQPQEERHAGKPHHTADVGHGPDARGFLGHDQTLSSAQYASTPDTSWCAASRISPTSSSSTSSSVTSPITVPSRSTTLAMWAPLTWRLSSASWSRSPGWTEANGRIHLSSITRERLSSSDSRASLMWR